MTRIALRHWLLSSVTGIALAASTLLSSAADPIIVNSFDASSEVSSWSELSGQGAVSWMSESGGCLKVSLPGGMGNQVQPQVALGTKSFNSVQYWSVSFDIKVDPNSSLSSDGTTYGHYQVVVRNSSLSWTGLNWTVLDSSYAAGWHHVELGFVQPYDTLSYLVFQVQGDSSYPAEVIYYLDNIKVNPLPSTVMLNAFTNASEVSAYGSWGATGSGISWIDTPDAGGQTPAGSMKILGNYDGSVSGWSEATCQRDYSFDPSRFTYFDFDVYLDPASATPYGGVTAFLRQNHAPWGWLLLGGHSFAAADAGKWVHVSLPMAPTSETNASGFVLQTGGNGMTAPVISYVDNVKIYTPQVTPRLTKIEKAGPGGVSVTMDQAGAQWQRDALATPANGNYTWYNSGGTTYSFTITNFPDAARHPGFSTHMFLVNEDTIPGNNPAWNETYGGCDWNAADIVVARLENNAAGGVDFSFRYKTNLPGADTDHTLGTLHAPSALGTWSVTFAPDNVTVTLSGPGVSPETFTLPQEVADRFNCSVSFLQFGAFKNDGAGSGVNDGVGVTFSRVQMTAGSFAFDDNFSAGLTGTYQWRTTSASAVSWTPEGTAWWLAWTVPDDGFTVEVAGNVAGPYTDAGVVYKSTQGASRLGAIPASSVPSGNAAFFRLSKPVSP